MLEDPLRSRSSWIEGGSYRVQIRINEPLSGEGHLGTVNLNATSFLISICSKIEILYENSNQMSLQSTNASRLLKQLKETIRKIQSSKDDKTYFEESGFARIFPTVHSLLSNISPRTVKTSSFEDYINSISVLNQLVFMSSQLRTDVINLNNHKYVAHQIALLYQCLNQAGDAGIVYKKRVEQMFDSIKTQTESTTLSLLLPEQKDWLIKLTTDIISDISNFTNFKQKLEPLLDYLKA